ncbi:MAG TPA: DUF1579 family protein [Thermoanaerobaculia bacterium]|jgi:ABC-type nitrate/sulfonate/bicarbonate transport system substrate-binding protein
MKRILFPVIVLAFAATCVYAADAPPGPNPKLKELKYFTGNWQCTGTGFAFMGTPEHKTTASVEAGWMLNDYWLSLRYHENKTALNAQPADVRISWGWDEAVKKFASGSVDNMGSYGIQYSPGWEGDKLTFNGEMHTGGPTMKVRDVFTKVSATKVQHMSEVEMNGKWTKLDEETCSKK